MLYSNDEAILWTPFFFRPATFMLIDEAVSAFVIDAKA